MSRRIKVLVLTASLNTGGAETFILNLLRHFDRAGGGRSKSYGDVEIHLCAFGSKSIYGDRSQLPKVRELNIPVKLIPAKRFYDLRTLVQIRRYIIQNDIALIHTFLSHADIVGNIVGRWLKLPVITSLRNMPLEYQALRFDLRWLMKNVAIRFATKLVALSEDIRLQSMTAWQLDAERITTIHNGTALNELRKIPLGNNRPNTQSEIVVTTIGRLAPQKAHTDLLRAAKIVVSQFPSVKFQIAGEGALRPVLEALARELEIESHVALLGARQDIPRILSGSDIFVLSSLWEGMSMAAIEAMAAGRPQVLTLVGANSELIVDGQQGLLVPPAAPEALAEAILKLVRNKALREQMGANARKRAIEQFSIETACEKYQALYVDSVRVLTPSPKSQ